MAHATLASPALRFLEDRWVTSVADTLDEPELLRYRSNLLGSDLRITNFAGGNTSSKIMQADPLTGETVEVLWVKGSGGDLGSMKRTGFATLYQQKLLALERTYKGVDAEDDMVAMYPLCTFGNNPVAASRSISAVNNPSSPYGCQHTNVPSGFTTADVVGDPALAQFTVAK